MAQAPYTTAPTVGPRASNRRQIDQPVSDSAGLEALGNSFSQFFGRAMETMADARLREELRKVSVQNEREQIQGWKDENLGAPVDPALADDEDYLLTRERVAAKREVGAYQQKVAALARAADEAAKAQAEADALGGARTQGFDGNLSYEVTYAEVLGRSHAASAASELVAAIKVAGVSDDVEGAAGEALKKAFGSGLGGEYGPFYNKEFLKQWDQQVRPAISAWKTDRAKQQTLLARDTLASVAGNAVQQPGFGIGDLKGLLNNSLVLHPGEEAKAYPWLMGVVIDSVAGTPDGTARVSKLLEEPGLGPNGESFAKLFPHMASELQAKLVNQWKNHTSAEGFARYRAVSDSLTDLELGQGALLPKEQQLARAHEIGQTLLMLVNRFGGYNSEFTGLQAKLEGWYRKHSEDVAGLNQYAALINGKIDWMDQKDINKVQEEYLRAKGLDPLRSIDDARQAAYIVGRGKLIATSLSGKMNFAMGDFSNPEQQRSSFYFWKGLEEQGLAKEWMSPESRRTFLAVNAYVNATQKDPLEVLSRMSANPELREMPDKPENFKWMKILGKGKDENEAYVNARKMLVDHIGKAFGISSSDVIVSSSAEKDLLMAAGGNTLINTAAGLGNAAEQGFADAAKDLTTNYMLVPAAGYKSVVHRRTLPPRTPDGKPVVSPGMQKNPFTGQVEDTNQTFREDAVQVSTMLPGRVGAAKDVYVIPEREAQESGAFTVMSGSAPVMFSPGETITKELAGTGWWDRMGRALMSLADEYKSKKIAIQDNKLKLPKDPDSAAALLRQTLPEGFDVVVNRDPSDEAYLKMVYRFRFKQGDGEAAARARIFQRMNVPVPGPLPTTDQLQNIGP